MKVVRQLIHKGDPRLNVAIPKAIKATIIDVASVSKRSLQDEIIKRLAATITNEETYKDLKCIAINQMK